MILKQRKKTKISGIGAEKGQKTQKTQKYYFGGRFFGGENNFFFQKLEFSNFMNIMNRCMGLNIMGCARSYVYGAKQVKKRQKRKNVNFGGKFGGQNPEFFS